MTVRQDAILHSVRHDCARPVNWTGDGVLTVSNDPRAGGSQRREERSKLLTTCCPPGAKTSTSLLTESTPSAG